MSNVRAVYSALENSILLVEGTSPDGNPEERYLDWNSQLMSVLIGHSHPHPVRGHAELRRSIRSRNSCSALSFIR